MLDIRLITTNDFALLLWIINIYTLQSARKKVALLLEVVPVGLELVVSSLKLYVGKK